MKKNIYMFQIDYFHGKNAFLPYAVGTLIAAAKQDPAIAERCRFHAPLFIREPLQDALGRVEEPFLVGFSNYIWNHEYNKALAREIKRRYPECRIVFGGHHLLPDGSLLREEPAVDVLIFGEGEEVFPALLHAYLEDRGLTEVPNLAYREGDAVAFTKRERFTRTDYPSPYLSGVFDEVLQAYPGVEFLAVMETVRGCPYACAYCDDGAVLCRVRAFPEERAMAELMWFANHGIFGLGAADSNFGMFERDERLVDEMVRLHNERGAFTAFQASYAKKSNDRVFRITKKLNDCGMNKGATLSFQSLDPQTLKNIRRENISVESFTALLNRYNAAGIATYSELILGLPGETPESFFRGIDVLLNAGQHNAIYIHNCEWLPVSAMAEPAFAKEHGVRAVRVPLNQPHRTLTKEEIPEYSHIVVETCSMAPADWVAMNLYSVTIQAFHHEGLLQLFALYLHTERGLAYSAFYRALLRFLLERPETVGGRVMTALRDRFAAVAEGRADLVCEDRRFGDIGWPAEEYALLNILYESEAFYAEIREFLAPYFEDTALFEALLRFQQAVLKKPFAQPVSFDCPYDFKTYFTALLGGRPAGPLRKTPCRYRIDAPVRTASWPEHARLVVWYGRKNSSNLYVRELMETLGCC